MGCTPNNGNRSAETTAPEDALRHFAVGEVESRGVESGQLIEAFHLRFVFEKFRRRNRDSVEVLIPEMLEEEDEARRICVRQGLNEKRADQGENGGGRADTEGEGQNPDKGEKRILDEKTERVANFLEHWSMIA